MKLVFVEGNIGSGKSTYLDFLEKKGETVLREPVKAWQDVNGHNLLDLMYTDTEKHGFLFQVYAFVSRMKLVLEQKNTETVYCERSVYTDRFIFFKTLHDMKKISSVENEVYISLWDFWIERMTEIIKDYEISFLYIDCSPELCFQHLKKRNRSEETGVSQEYLNTLHISHKQIYNYQEILAFGKNREIKTITNDGTDMFFRT